MAFLWYVFQRQICVHAEFSYFSMISDVKVFHWSNLCVLKDIRYENKLCYFYVTDGSWGPVGIWRFLDTVYMFLILWESHSRDHVSALVYERPAFSNSKVKYFERKDSRRTFTFVLFWKVYVIIGKIFRFAICLKLASSIHRNRRASSQMGLMCVGLLWSWL